MSARQPAVAGSFYPRSASELRSMLASLLADPSPGGLVAGAPSARPAAIIAPHAGYIYSGATAAAAYRLLTGVKVKRVVLLGPAHRVWLRGLGTSSFDAWRTPLGEVPLEYPASLDKLRQVGSADGAHGPEHSLEVQVPFLQTVLAPGWTLTPLIVGQASAAEVADTLDAAIQPDVLIVISSDLSHYHPYDEARALDRVSVGQILALGPELTHDQACGATPVNGMLEFARRHDWRPALLAQCNSGDLIGDVREVVGYASIAFHPRAAGEGSGS